MEIRISGQGVDLGENLKSYIEEHLEENVNKYFSHATSAKVAIFKEAKHHLFHVDIVVNEGVAHGAFVKGSDIHSDVYIAVDGAIAKIAKKLRRYKEKLNNHHKSHNAGSIIKSRLLQKYDEKHAISPVVVGEESLGTKRLSVEDAIMHRDFMNLPVFVFTNIETGKLNIVYEKPNGHVVLIDVTEEESVQ